MNKVTKNFGIQVKRRGTDGGRIRITTGGIDRDRDIVQASGAVTANYLANPVVQFAHNYKDPWATVGRTKQLDFGVDHIDADFQLRPAANEHDPQNVVRLLWEGDWIRTASIGFQPIEYQENEHGGLTFTKWELLEWSLVAVPANAGAVAMGMTAKGLGRVAPVAKAITEARHELVVGKAYDLDRHEQRQMIRVLDGLAGLLPYIARYVD